MDDALSRSASVRFPHISRRLAEAGKRTMPAARAACRTMAWVFGSVCGIALITGPVLAQTAGDHQATLRSAQAACNSGDFAEFFHLYALSPPVRKSFTMSMVSVVRRSGERQVPRADYKMPIERLDWNYIVTGTFASHGNVPATADYVDLRFRAKDDGTAYVDWIRARYDGNHEGGDGLGNVAERIGLPGRLLFRRDGAGCWQLVADVFDPVDAPFRAGPAR